VLLSVGTALLFGLLPVLRAGRASGMAVLRSDVRAGSSKLAGKASYLLAVAQVSLAVTLVTCAGLLIKNLWQLQQVSLGFNTTNVVATTIPLPSFPNDTASRAPQFYDAVLQQARQMPGVLSVAIASSLPFGDGIQSAAMEVEAHPTPPGGAPSMPQLSAVSVDFFRTLSIPLVAGRLLTDADREGSTRVGVIDEAAARSLRRCMCQRVRDFRVICGSLSNPPRRCRPTRSPSARRSRTWMARCQLARCVCCPAL